MTINQLFDLIAPIYIYFFADIAYQREARRAFTRLRTERDLKTHLPLHLSEQTASSVQESLERSSKIDELRSGPILDAYSELFTEIVMKRIAGLTTTNDFWGACCFRDQEGNLHLAGDVNGHYPFYLDALALERRLDDLEKEMAGEGMLAYA
jgi:hypothetical protein